MPARWKRQKTRLSSSIERAKVPGIWGSTLYNSDLITRLGDILKSILMYNQNKAS